VLLATQHSTLNTQHSTLNTQHSTLNSVLLRYAINGIITDIMSPISAIFVGGPLSSVHEDEVAEETVIKLDELKQLRSPEKADRKPAPLQKRSVHMSPNVHYREIPHLTDLSDEEVNAVWLAPEDYIETKRVYSRIVQMMMRSREPIEETDEICTRGLGTFLILHDQWKFR
jgi:hypothetical protein